MWDIAAAHLAPGERTVANVHRYWRQVHRANRRVIGADPDLIHPGTRLEVPPVSARPTMRRRSGAPPFPSVALPELLGTAEPAPPARPRGSRLLKLLARVVLWSLIAVGAPRGLLPAPEGPAATGSTGPPDDRRAAAVAAAFVREYLTVGDDRMARAGRSPSLAATPSTPTWWCRLKRLQLL